MKKRKFIVAITAILFSTNLLFAGNPDKLATKMVEKLNAYISLNDSQKVFIQAKAKEFAVKMQNANSLASKPDKSIEKKQAFQQYKAILDSVLTSDQKMQLTSKQNERKAAILKKIKTKK